MGVLRPRRLAHRGTVLAAGFLVDEALVGAIEARRRILELGGVARVRRLDAGLVVALREPAWVDSARAPGAPLVRVGGALCAAPLYRDEIDALAPASGATLLVREGAIVVVGADDGSTEDPAAWIDVNAFSAVEVAPLGSAIDAPAPPPPPAVVEVRRALGIGELPREAKAVSEALARRGARAPARGQPLGHALRDAAGRLLQHVSRFFGERGARAEPAARRGLVVDARRPRAGLRWLDALRAALQQAAARWLVRLRFASMVGRRHADYLARMLEMFDTGDYERALRHAIPLGDGAGGAPKPPSLSTPTPRAQLAIELGRKEASAAIGLGGDLLAALRARYRRAHERLAAEGRIEEAAFVLAELLKASEEAVLFLERHGRLRLAAELAEGRELAPGLVVRQWILAGDRDRAVAIARRTGAFADAVARLEPSHRQHAEVLRLLWAERLAAAGAYAAAVDAVWPVEAARGLAAAWLDRGIEVGGLSGARLLARKALLSPEAFPSVVVSARALLGEGGAEGQLTTLAFARGLLAGSKTPEIQLLARAAARALLPRRDESATQGLIEDLIAAADDPVLRADARGLRGSAAVPPREIRFRAAARTQSGPHRAQNYDGFVFLASPSASAFEERLGSASPERADIVDGAIPGAGLGKRADAFITEGALPAHGAVFAVLDGAGGWGGPGNEVAARALIEALTPRGDDAEAPWTRLAAAFQAAHRKLLLAGEGDDRDLGALCRATAAALVGDVLWVAHVGDTRAYVVRAGGLAQVTRDHSLVEVMLAEGKLTPQEAERFEHRHVLVRTLGGGERMEVDLFSVALRRGDRILLCTDGIHAHLSRDVLRALLVQHTNPGDACEALIQRALEVAEGRDNATAVVVDVRGAGLLEAISPEVEPVRVEVAPTAGAASERTVVRRAADTGALSVLDAAVLPGGRVLVALGEAGARLVSPDGRTLVHFAEPAHRLVVSDHGDRALALAPRGEAYRITRLDLVGRRGRAWCDARFTRFAPDFDGEVWLIGAGESVDAIDTLDDAWSSLWRVSEPGAGAGPLARSPDVASFLLGDELWTVALPSFRLSRRRKIAEGAGLVGVVPSPRGRLAAWKTHGDGLEAVHQSDNTASWRALSSCAAGAQLDVAVSERLTVFVHRAETACIAAVIDASRVDRRMRVVMEGASSLRVRIQDQSTVVVADDRGRLLLIDGNRGDVLAEWRIPELGRRAERERGLVPGSVAGSQLRTAIAALKAPPLPDGARQSCPTGLRGELPV